MTKQVSVALLQCAAVWPTFLSRKHKLTHSIRFCRELSRRLQLLRRVPMPPESPKFGIRSPSDYPRPRPRLATPSQSRNRSRLNPLGTSTPSSSTLSAPRVPSRRSRTRTLWCLLSTSARESPQSARLARSSTTSRCPRLTLWSLPRETRRLMLFFQKRTTHSRSRTRSESCEENRTLQAFSSPTTPGSE